MIFYREGLFNILDDQINATLENFTYKIDNLYDFIYFFNKNKYFSDLIVKPGLPDDNSFGNYDLKNKTISIYAQAIIFNRMKELEGLDNFKKVSMVYFDLIRCLAHEIEHSKQIKLKNAILNNTLEKRLLVSNFLNDDYYIEDLAFKIISSKKMTPSISNIQKIIFSIKKIWCDLYHENYNSVLIERLADINAYSFLEHLYHDNPKYNLCFDYAQSNKFICYASGYKFTKEAVIAPTVDFMEKLSSTVLLKEIPFEWYDPNPLECYKNIKDLYDFKIRLKYGLPLSLDEYYTIINMAADKTNNFEKKYKIKLKDSRGL